jgi:hypothetical protein
MNVFIDTVTTQHGVTFVFPKAWANDRRIHWLAQRNIVLTNCSDLPWLPGKNWNAFRFSS